jgi:hypothetical protein
MKKIVFVLFISMIVFWGCEPQEDTSLTIRNLASGSIYLNFRGEVTTVPAGKTVVMTKLPRGTYAYVTTYSVPAGANSSTAIGELEGEMIFKSGTKYLILYSSTFTEDTYTIYASKTSNEDLDPQDNPLFP